MARIQHMLFIGIHNSVLALDPRDGTELWRVKLGGSSLVNVYWDGEELYASTKGEVFRLDHRTGQVVWHNKLKGLGLGFVTLASTRAPNLSAQQVPAEAARQAQARQSAAGAT